jgi:hypothetical protein
VFDAARSCDVRLAGSTAPAGTITVVPLEELDDLGASG